MSAPIRHAAILHTGPWKKVFGDFPAYLSKSTGLPVVDRPDDICLAYVLGWHEYRPLPCESFIPLDSIFLARDKRKQAIFFHDHGIMTPDTYILNSEEEVFDFCRRHNDKEWLLKWPVGCGGLGHQVLNEKAEITPLWQPPFLVQELIRMKRPKVYRLFVAGGETFNWCVREYESETNPSPFVSCQQGARARLIDPVPEAARILAERALQVSMLYDSFGAVDIIQSDQGDWYVLELNTDGIYSYLERIVPLLGFTEKMEYYTNKAIEKRLEIIKAQETN